MYRITLLLFFSFLSLFPFAQPGIKGKRLDTTQAILGADTTLTKLVEFRDSLARVGPAAEDLREPMPTDNTLFILLIVGSVIVIVWAGRRAWLRGRK